MTETGTMALTMCLTTIAFLTDQVLLLPIIAMPLVITPLSNILQLSWRKLFGKKLWLITPIHHHFEALGVPSYQITMKYWIVSVICALAGLVLALIG
jgi:phospho-N-acetylmuramoyl-pentapeptide-transferase